MGDFGPMVIVKRRDGKSMDDGNRARLDQAISLVKAANPPQDAVGKPFRFQIIENSPEDGDQDFAVVLSEYWLEGIDEGVYGLSAEEILAADRPTAQRAQESLGAELGPEYETELVCNVW